MSSSENSGPKNGRSGNPGNKSICIVDDSEDVSEMLALLVRRLGYRVECVAHEGKEIIQTLETGKRPDLILMDYRMMGMNGLDAAREILRIDPKVKIIICTADESVKAPAKSAGLGFLQKPFSGSALAEALKNSFDWA